MRYFPKWMRLIIYMTGLAHIILLPSATVQAVMPPRPDQPFPSSVQEMAASIRGQYGHNGLAVKLQRLRQQKIRQMQENGGTFSSEVVSVSVPVLMGNYSDVSHIFTNAQFQTLLFGSNPAGSMTDYYNEVSYGQLNLTGSVFGPYTASNTQAYYVNSSNGFGVYPKNAPGFIKSILSASDGAINFAQFDNDGPDGVANSGDDDGVVDALIVIFPDGDASGGDNDNIWAHQWALRYGSKSPYITDDEKFGGGFITADDYTIQGSEQGNGLWNVIMPIGVFCHEFGHILGLPDLYDYDRSSFGVGTWCLMGSGAWGASWNYSTQHRPVHMSAWCKSDVGWAVPRTISDTQNVTIDAVEIVPDIYKLWDDAYQGGRYFLVENRQATRFDADIYGSGLLIWHINEEVFDNSSVDSDRTVDLEEADGLAEIDNKVSWMDAGDVFPGSSGNTSIDDMSNPNSKDVFGNSTGAAVTGIVLASPSSCASSTTDCYNATFIQRDLRGYTISYDSGPFLQPWPTGAPAGCWGAVKFTTPQAGALFAVQVGVTDATNFTLSIYNDLISGSPVGIRSITRGSFPFYGNFRYHEVPLSSSLSMDSNRTFVVDVGFGPPCYGTPYVEWPPYSGNSYFSTDGINYHQWTDKNLAIRARIKYMDCTSKPGDVNGDGKVDVVDVVHLVNVILRSWETPMPSCRSEVTGDGNINLSDVIYLANYIFEFASAPVPTGDCCLPIP